MSYEEQTLAKLLKEAEEVKNFVVVNNYSGEKLIELANELKKRKPEIDKIYWLDGADILYYPSFDSIKLPLRFVIRGKDLRSSVDGLIFRQNVPVILVIQNFDRLQLDDQGKYINQICKKEAHDYHPHNYLHPESIVILELEDIANKPKFSYKVEVRVIKEQT